MVKTTSHCLPLLVGIAPEHYRFCRLIKHQNLLIAMIAIRPFHKKGLMSGLLLSNAMRYLQSHNKHPSHVFQE